MSSCAGLLGSCVGCRSRAARVQELPSLVGGPSATAGFFLALAKAGYFWIANVIYLGFVLWAVAGPAIKLVAYRRGLPPSS